MMQRNQFFNQLRKLNKEFRFKEALDLSDRIHDAEGAGYKVSVWEDYEWSKLTDKIEEARKK